MKSMQNTGREQRRYSDALQFAREANRAASARRFIARAKAQCRRACRRAQNGATRRLAADAMTELAGLAADAAGFERKLAAALRRAEFTVVAAPDFGAIAASAFPAKPATAIREIPVVVRRADRRIEHRVLRLAA
ncbi:MAG: hypothetical protein L6Q73_17545 [Aquabacterium sp.]|nr:hypothetical protein [Aquabacterium sp.]